LDRNKTLTFQFFNDFRLDTFLEPDLRVDVTRILGVFRPGIRETCRDAESGCIKGRLSGEAAQFVEKYLKVT